LKNNVEDRVEVKEYPQYTFDSGFITISIGVEYNSINSSSLLKSIDILLALANRNRITCSTGDDDTRTNDESKDTNATVSTTASLFDMNIWV
jgi:hypothetical protein